MPVEIDSIVNIIAALGALGTASFGLVDATKAFWGGISRCGIRNIRDSIKPVFGSDLSDKDRSTPLTYASVLDNLKANWMNGRDLVEQKAIAKTLLKLRLDPSNAEKYAAATGVDAGTLRTIANLIKEGKALDAPQADAFGRFDLALTALIDQGYQRADQKYRNSAKVLAMIFSIVFAVLGNWILSGNGYWSSVSLWEAVLAGALAAPLAPIVKDLTSALVAGVAVAQKSGK